MKGHRYGEIEEGESREYGEARPVADKEMDQPGYRRCGFSVLAFPDLQDGHE